MNDWNNLLGAYMIGVIWNLYLFTKQKIWTRNAFLPQLFICFGSLISLMWILLYNSETKANGQ